jgi:hypothetical protein
MVSPLVRADSHADAIVHQVAASPPAGGVYFAARSTALIIAA